MTAPRIVCLGDLMIDVHAQLRGPLAVGSDSPAPIELRGGGSAANTAAWLVACGVAATFVGCAGSDALGRLALDGLRAAGVELAVTLDAARPTGTCIVLVDPSGERTMVPSIGANAALGAADEPDLPWPAVAGLHISAYAVFADGARPAARAAADHAIAAGCPVSVDAASAAPLEAFGAERFLAWLPRSLLFANTDEARVLTGLPDPVEAATVLGARCGEAIVKCGADGAVWSDGVSAVHEPAVPVVPVDSTGAGDAFAAAVLAARAVSAAQTGGVDVAESLRRGVHTAALAVAQAGARPPRRGGTRRGATRRC